MNLATRCPSYELSLFGRLEFIQRMFDSSTTAAAAAAVSSKYVRAYNNCVKLDKESRFTTRGIRATYECPRLLGINSVPITTSRFLDELARMCVHANSLNPFSQESSIER